MKHYTTLLEIEQIAESVAAGEVTTDALLADGWKSDIVSYSEIEEILDPAPKSNQIEVAVAPVWEVTDGDGTIIVPRCDYESPRDAAEEFVYSAEWPETDETVWVRVVVRNLGVTHDGQAVSWNAGRYTIAVDPDEPDCTDDGGHDWVEDYTTFHGGSTYTQETCAICGLRKITDGWARDPKSGAEGLHSVSYART